MSELTDWRGNTIEQGDTIIYTVRGGSTHTVHEAVVTETGYSENDWYDRPQPFVKATWKRCSNAWENRERTIKNVCLTNVSSITVLAKANANV